MICRANAVLPAVQCQMNPLLDERGGQKTAALPSNQAKGAFRSPEGLRGVRYSFAMSPARPLSVFFRARWRAHEALTARRIARTSVSIRLKKEAPPRNARARPVEPYAPASRAENRHLSIGGDEIAGAPLSGPRKGGLHRRSAPAEWRAAIR